MNQLFDSLTDLQLGQISLLDSTFLDIMNQAEDQGLNEKQVAYALSMCLMSAMFKGGLTSIEEVSPVDGALITITYTQAEGVSHDDNS